MCRHCVDNQVYSVSMPRIGCGLDGLEWPKVIDIIKDIFGSVEMNVTVYSL